jgi:hypothetical protein
MATATELQKDIDALRERSAELVESIESASGDGAHTWKLVDELMQLKKSICSKQAELDWLLIPEN